MGAQPSMEGSDRRDELEAAAIASGGALCGMSANHFSAPSLHRLDGPLQSMQLRATSCSELRPDRKMPIITQRARSSGNDRSPWHRTKGGALVSMGPEISDTESDISEASTPSLKRTFSQSSDVSEHERRHDVNTWPLRRQRLNETTPDSGQMDLWEVTRSLSRERADLSEQLSHLTAGPGASEAASLNGSGRADAQAPTAAAAEDFLARDLQKLVEQEGEAPSWDDEAMLESILSALQNDPRGGVAGGNSPALDRRQAGWPAERAQLSSSGAASATPTLPASGSRSPAGSATQHSSCFTPSSSSTAPRGSEAVAAQFVATPVEPRQYSPSAPAYSSPGLPMLAPVPEGPEGVAGDPSPAASPAASAADKDVKFENSVPDNAKSLPAGSCNSSGRGSGPTTTADASRSASPSDERPANQVRPKEYKCKRCGAPKKGHICMAQREVGGRDGARKEWATEEDNFILKNVATIGCRWRAIASSLPGRSDDAVRNRWNRLREQVDTSRFGIVAGGLILKDDRQPSGAEDPSIPMPLPLPMPPPTLQPSLVQCVSCNKVSSSSSASVSDDHKRSGADRSSAGEERAPARAEERRKGERVGWTPGEDKIIAESVQELGHRWFLIAERLPGRTDHAIRNRWHRLQAMHQDLQHQKEMKQHHLSNELASSGPVPARIQGFDRHPRQSSPHMNGPLPVHRQHPRRAGCGVGHPQHMHAGLVRGTPRLSGPLLAQPNWSPEQQILQEQQLRELQEHLDGPFDPFEGLEPLHSTDAGLQHLQQQET